MKSSSIAVPVGLLVLVAFLVTPPARSLAQGRAVIKGGQELVEQMTRRGGAKAAAEIAEMGGDVAVRETLERAAKEGGEQLVGKVSRYGAAHGPIAVRAVRASPAKMVAALDQMPSNLTRPALQAAAREPDVLARLVASHGAGALETAARHPGVGSKLVTSLGDDGLKLGRSLTTDQAVVVARHADEIAKLPAAQRGGVMQALAKSPARVVGYLEQHPRVLLTAAGVVTVVALKDEIAGTTELALDAVGNPIAVTKPGLIERVFAQPVRQMTNVLGLVLAALLAAWGSVHLWGAWRVHLLRVHAERAKLARAFASALRS